MSDSPLKDAIQRLGQSGEGLELTVTKDGVAGEATKQLGKGWSVSGAVQWAKDQWAAFGKVRWSPGDKR